MAVAFYFDPAKEYHATALPSEKADIGFWRLLDCDAGQLTALHVAQYPESVFMIAEIYPQQVALLPRRFDRLSIVLKGNDLWVTHNIPHENIDITFMWDGRYALSRYLAMIGQWLERGVKHFSFYGLNDFAQWQKLQEVLQQNNVHFYDRFHAAVQGAESPYQKHLAQYGDIIAWGGWSRVTDAQNITHVKTARAKNWRGLSTHEQNLEKLLFGLADSDGIDLRDWHKVLLPANIKHACENGFAIVEQNRLKPTSAGMWDNIGLVAEIYK